MNHDKHQYAPGTRAARLLQLRDAIVQHELAMREVSPGILELAVGMFVIQYAVPSPLASQRLWNITIWPSGATGSGYNVHGSKIASFGWSDRDEIFIHAFNCGEWENELLKLLTDTKGTCGASLPPANRP